MNLGATEIMVIVLLAVFLFGAGRIADLGKGLGQGIKNFKQGIREAEEEDTKKGSSDKGGAASASTEKKDDAKA
jgi:sec-independent protein translocase protein TatA